MPTHTELPDRPQTLPHEIAWSAPVHERRARSTDWYWALGIIGVCGAIASVLWGNVLFAVIIALGALSVGVLSAREPREHDVRIDEHGVVVDGDFYPYERLHSFWVAGGHDVPRLFISTDGIVHPHLVLGIYAPATLEDVYDYLAHFLPVEESHSLGTLAAELLGL